MGIYDRDYMDGSEDSRYGSAGTRRFSALTVLIIINIVVWVLWQFSHTNPALYRFLRDNFTASSVGVLEHFRFHTLLTSSVSHQDPWHISMNMLFLYFLGQEVELRYGRKNFYVIYVFTALLTGLGYVGVDLLKARSIPMLGASGCVMGVGVIAAFLEPNRIMLIMGLIPIKLKWLISLYIMVSVAGVLGDNDGIAHAAHLGGAFGGLLFYWYDLRMFGSTGRVNVSILYRIKNWFRRKPSLRLVEKRKASAEEFEESLIASSKRKREQHSEADSDAKRATPHADVDLKTAQRVDELLAKIHRDGINSLTQNERNFLNASSQKYKRK